MVFTNGTGLVPNSRLTELVRKHFDLTPRDIIHELNLQRPIFKETAAYGHFGRELPNFSWEKTDKVDELIKDA